jgi:ribosomal protein S18 acetylase RimI-like enzyme
MNKEIIDKSKLTTFHQNLNKKLILKINNLILQNFKTSRLNTYETLIYKMIDNEVVGFMGLHKYYDNNNNDYISINQLCVDINYRNQGIATELLNSLPDNEKYILFIDKNNDNSHLKLIDFYKKRGFILSSENNIEIKMKK